MSRHKPKRRQHKLIAFKAYFDSDADILDWWESIEAGDRSDALRDLIRAHLGLHPQKRKTQIIDLPELIEVRRDTLWIKDALNDMPAYLERVIQHVAANASTQFQQAREPTDGNQHQNPALTSAESQRRTRRMKQATW